MRRSVLLALLVLMFSVASRAAVADTTMARFDLTHYADWTYHRVGAELDSYFIQLGKVVLLTTEGGEFCTLESPGLDCRGIDSLKVLVDYRPFNTQYAASKLALKIDLLDNEGLAVSTVTLPAVAKVYQMELVAMLPVPSGGDYTLLFSAPDADKDNCAAVRAVKVWAVTATEHLKGDVTGDGVIDIADINALINIILGWEEPETYQGRAYVTDDDIIDIADINALINAILGH